jgi:LmbE family N-acetylglucosaminyl deacetylase
MTARGVGDRLPHLPGVLAVCAHPDDESFGLGAVLATLAGQGSALSVLCFTHGEASTLGAASGDLRRIRAAEFAAAGEELGVDHAELLDYPDGGLSDVPLGDLADDVRRMLRRCGAGALLVFDEGGITGHPDHRHATAAALAATEADDLDVIAWVIPADVADTLNTQFGTAFVGRPADEIDLSIPVDRGRQLAAISCHASQSTDNPALWRGLQLLAGTEHLRHLRPRNTVKACEP